MGLMAFANCITVVVKDAFDRAMHGIRGIVVEIPAWPVRADLGGRVDGMGAPKTKVAVSDVMEVDLHHGVYARQPEAGPPSDGPLLP